MNGSAISDAARPVGRGSNQRVTETNRRTELDQPFLLGWCFGLGPDPELLRGAPQQGRVAQGFGGGDQQESLRLFGQRPDASKEALLDLACQRPRRGDREATCQLASGQSAGQLQQRQRDAPRLGDDPVAHPLVEPPETRRVQQRPRISVAQATDRPIGQPLQLHASVGSRTANTSRDRLSQQPPRDEREGLRRDLVQPLRVVNEADQRSLLGSGRQQTQHRQTDQEAIRCIAGDQPECRAERVALRSRQLLEVVDNIGAHNSCTPANASSISASTPDARTT